MAVPRGAETQCKTLYFFFSFYLYFLFINILIGQRHEASRQKQLYMSVFSSQLVSSLPFPFNSVRNFPQPPSLILNALAWARTSIRVDEMGGSQGVPQVGLHTFLVWKVVGETAILLPPEQLQALVKKEKKKDMQL